VPLNVVLSVLGNCAEDISPSNLDECGKNGGDWVNGTTYAPAITYNEANDMFSIYSSDGSNNYFSNASAPGSQTSGSACYGDCTYSYSQAPVLSPSSPFWVGVKSFFSLRQMAKTTYHSFADENGCDGLMVETLRDDLSPFPGSGPGPGEAKDSAHAVAYAAGLARANAYANSQRLIQPMSSSIFRSMRGDALELSETVGRKAPEALMVYAAADSIGTAAGAAAAGTCH
jgi:hypothetical protein